jgi:hypothetical protein
MTKVVLDNADVVAALDAIEGRSQLCDSSGRVLGYYLPQTCDEPVRYRGVKSPLSAEERERLIREEGPLARTLADFWEDMRCKHPEQFQ